MKPNKISELMMKGEWDKAIPPLINFIDDQAGNVSEQVDGIINLTICYVMLDKYQVADAVLEVLQSTLESLTDWKIPGNGIHVTTAQVAWYYFSEALLKKSLVNYGAANFWLNHATDELLKGSRDQVLENLIITAIDEINESRYPYIADQLEKQVYGYGI